MRINCLAILLMAVVFLFSCSNKRTGNPKVLVFTKTAAFYHQSIAVGAPAIMKLGVENGFDVDTTSNADYFNEDSLKNYSAIVFLSNTGALFTTNQRIAFERYIQAGGGFVGVHGASDAEYDWGWYNRLIGGYFNGHPHQQVAKLVVKDKTHGSTSHLPDVWERKDEWYNFKKLNNDVNVLITIDEASYKGGTNGDHHPMAWYHDYDGGRAFYTGLGHTDESYQEPHFLSHLLGGITYAIGKNEVLNYKKATSQYPPDEDRFTKVTLAEGLFFEPTEMTILPNLDILVVQRRGEILLYKHDTKQLLDAGFLNVYHQSGVKGVNAEEGLMGLAKDPNFKDNNYIYMFYAPVDTSVNRLSRFTFQNDKVVEGSEKVILEFYSQRQICCHTGGSIAFDAEGLLYVSTGDNSTPFNQPNSTYQLKGYGPIDDRAGREQYDARRSSGNTNDLRGKILRLKIHEDGSYTIPEGNLFPEGTDKTRPEIYVMGNRNPYRISVDPKNGFLYWGEVGPDAREDSFGVRGPRGYDEVNQARKAGNFGWPYFVGKNYAYNRYDFEAGTHGEAFDPEKPLNESRSNTGLTELPPVAPAFIWYGYNNSQDFPQVGSGGRNAMAGPAYYTDMFPKETRLPDYYNGKLFIYEWIRGWVKVVSLTAEGDFDRMEPFMEGTKFRNLIDMEVGPDGKLYLLEYGSGWFSKNADAALSRIDYNGGNRTPKVGELKVDKKSGGLPLTVNVSVEAKDPEHDALTYIWSTNTGIKKETNEPSATIELDKAGDYIFSVEVKDKAGLSANSNSVSVYAGNTVPTVGLTVEGNQSFYFPGKPVKYVVSVNDTEDGSSIVDENLFVIADFLEGVDKAALPMGHQTGSTTTSGKTIMQSLDCASCHKETEKSVGPSFKEIADKYHDRKDAIPYMANKMIKGSTGVWGEVAMAAHPDLPEEDARRIADWILSLSSKATVRKSLPASGSIPVKESKPNEALYITANYTDKGGDNIKPLTGGYSKILSSNILNLNNVHNKESISEMSVGGAKLLLVSTNKASWFSINDIDLTGVTHVGASTGWQNAEGNTNGGYVIEFRLDGPDGQVLGEVKQIPTKTAADKPGSAKASAAIAPVTDGKKHNLYIVVKPVNQTEEANFALTGLWLEAK